MAPEKMAPEKMKFRTLTPEEVAGRRKRNIAIGISLAVVSALFLVTTMIRIGANMGSGS